MKILFFQMKIVSPIIEQYVFSKKDFFFHKKQIKFFLFFFSKGEV